MGGNRPAGAVWLRSARSAEPDPPPGARPGLDLAAPNRPSGSSNDHPPVQDVGLLPALSLPKGGGAIRGIDEKFAVNPVTGTGALTVPVASSPGRSGFGPLLSLSYDSGA